MLVSCKFCGAPIETSKSPIFVVDESGLYFCDGRCEEEWNLGSEESEDSDE